MASLIGVAIFPACSSLLAGYAVGQDPFVEWVTAVPDDPVVVRGSHGKTGKSSLLEALPWDLFQDSASRPWMAWRSSGGLSGSLGMQWPSRRQCRSRGQWALRPSQGSTTHGIRPRGRRGRAKRDRRHSRHSDLRRRRFSSSSLSLLALVLCVGSLHLFIAPCCR